MRLNTYKTNTEIVRRKTRLSKLREKIAKDVNYALENILPPEVSQNLAMARQMAKENEFEPSSAPLYI